MMRSGLRHACLRRNTESILKLCGGFSTANSWSKAVSCECGSGARGSGSLPTNEHVTRVRARPRRSLMRIGPALVDALAGAAGEVMRFDRPAAAVLAAFFRSHRELGQHDRAFVAETVYA